MNDLAAGGGYVPVAVTSRSGADESVHHGAVVVLDADGQLVFAAGDPDVLVYPRSALKPMQAAAMLDAGLPVSDEQLALVSASHDGTDRHCEIVLSILAGAGLDADALGNTASLPIDRDTALAMLRRGEAETPLRMNCSGKHAGMLATCVVNGWPIDDYLDVEHPLQQRITATIARLAELADGVDHIGVDGCGAPTHMFSLRALARAGSRVITCHPDVHRAMTTHPELVGGEGRDVTRLMRAVPGLMAKDGAEGVFVAALPDGPAVAVKIADGASRARPSVMVAALSLAGVDTSSVPDDLSAPVLGHGRPVGAIRAVIEG